MRMNLINFAITTGRTGRVTNIVSVLTAPECILKCSGGDYSWSRYIIIMTMTEESGGFSNI